MGVWRALRKWGHLVSNKLSFVVPLRAGSSGKGDEIG